MTCSRCNGTRTLRYETTNHGERSEFTTGECKYCLPPKPVTDAVLFMCDEAACHKDQRFYEAFDMDERWEIIRAIIDAALSISSIERGGK